MSGQTDKHVYGSNGPANEAALKSQYVVTGVVVRLQSPYALQVRLSIDRQVTDAELPWAYPLLAPGMLPIEGELVRVFLPDPTRPLAERYWIGPVFSDWQHLPGQRFAGNHFTLTTHNWVQQTGGTRVYPASDSRYPNASAPRRVHQLTRGNTDAIFDKDGTFLRSGRHEWKEPRVPNERNPGLMGLAGSSRAQSSVGVVRAETIALLTGNLTAKDTLNPTYEELATAAAAAHPLAFADVVAQYLEVFRAALAEHLHSGPGKKAINDEAMRKLLSLDFSELGSKNLVGN